MIAVLGAMEIEIDGFAALLQEAREERIGRFVCRVGTVGNVEAVAVCCGVGMVAAAAATAAVIGRFRPGLIVNVGVAGGLKGLRPLDLVLPVRVVQHDMDTTAVGDPLGYLSDLGQVFLETDAAARAGFRAVCPDLFECTLASGDTFVDGAAARTRLIESFGADCCDMEGGAILHAATLLDTPCVILRAISDNADGGDFNAFVRAAAQKTIAVLRARLDNYAEV